MFRSHSSIYCQSLTENSKNFSAILNVVSLHFGGGYISNKLSVSKWVDLYMGC